MALKFEVEYRKLDFSFKAGTSRGILNHKDTWFIKVFDDKKPGSYGLGEASPLKGLSIDDVPDFANKLNEELNKIKKYKVPQNPTEVFNRVSNVSEMMPSVRFSIESSLLDLMYGGKRKYFNNAFFDKGEPLLINGLVWMGTSDLMLQRLEEKLKNGFRCIKIKIGTIGYQDEMHLIENARNQLGPDKLELRVDANGAFSFKEAMPVLNRLKELGVHSIEQPIKAGQTDLMAKLCVQTPVPIALDEELIGITAFEDKKTLLTTIKPHYIILKPSLLGGFASCLEWIKIADEIGIGWWITSALESNIGLNAISQFASWLQVSMPQGLGTGNLFKNNIKSPLKIVGDQLYYSPNLSWGQVIK